MKTLLATIATIFVSLTAMPEKAEAAPNHYPVGHSYTYSIGHSACGCAIYQRRIVSGYDCYDRPIFRYYSVPVVHRCRTYVSRPHCGTGYTRVHYNRSYYSRYNHHRHHRTHSRFTVRRGHGFVAIGH